ncbi:MAG: hypothetical protein IJR89_06280 [Clostridia bacterium]|nr:hypothetical protein [Clostridia bacterium]
MNHTPQHDRKSANANRAALNAALVRVLAALSVLTLLTGVIFFGILIRQKAQAPNDPPASSATRAAESEPPVSGSETPPTAPVETENRTTDAATALLPPDTATPPETTPATDTPETDDPVTTPVTETAPVTPPDPGIPTSSVIVPETADHGADYLKDVYFLGDSTTYGMMVYAKDLVSYDHIWAGPGGTIDFVDIANKTIKWPDGEKSFGDWEEITIAEALGRAKPKILIVTLGINFSADGNSTWSEEKREQYFRKQVKAVSDIVKENSPNTKLAFQTIYPTIDSLTSIKNSRVDLRNEWLLAECEERNIPLIWSHTVMSDENGQLIAAYNADHGDGIHLNTAGFRAVLSFVRTHPVT